jgi:hypothetical protein
MSRNEDIDVVFDNMQLLRMQLYLSAEEFKQKNKHKYASEQELNRAARRYANTRHRSEGQEIWRLQGEVLGLEPKDI